MKNETHQLSSLARFLGQSSHDPHALPPQAHVRQTTAHTTTRADSESQYRLRHV